ncbi:hypothetical protein MMC24_007443 [Lignoscripta atroalba]|nr:hypothetical protein [Lignoscripta atroalba]
MAAPSTGHTGPDHDSQLFQQLDTYPWDTDEEFQTGLRAILGPNPSPEQAEQLTIRARCFYYSRQAFRPQHGVSIDFNGYRSWLAQSSSNAVTNGSIEQYQTSTDPPYALASTMSRSTTPPVSTESSVSTSSDASAPYPLSFNHIVDLITTGQPIPGVKEVPDTVLEGQASQAMKVKRKKPWEKTRPEDAVESG